MTLVEIIGNQYVRVLQLEEQNRAVVIELKRQLELNQVSAKLLDVVRLEALFNDALTEYTGLNGDDGTLLAGIAKRFAERTREVPKPPEPESRAHVAMQELETIPAATIPNDPTSQAD